MDLRRRLSNMFAFFTFKAVILVAITASNAAALPPQQLYWNSVLPDTPMPKALSQLLVQPELARPAMNFVDYKSDPNDNYMTYFVMADADKATSTLGFVFLEDDIYPGKTMTFSLGTSPSATITTFLPRKTAESIPFSSTQLPFIFNRFSVKPGSTEAHLINNTLTTCESPAMKGEEKYCVTSLEAMLDLIISKLGSGRNIEAISAEVEKGATHFQKYTISPGAKKLDDKFISCHKMSYPYAVFGCHYVKNTRAYVVPLRGADGTNEKAVAVCHTDTSDWPLDNFVFRVLNVKPGTVPICHFLPEGHLVWVPRV